MEILFTYHRENTPLQVKYCIPEGKVLAGKCTQVPDSTDSEEFTVGWKPPYHMKERKKEERKRERRKEVRKEGKKEREEGMMEGN